MDKVLITKTADMSCTRIEPVLRLHRVIRASQGPSVPKCAIERAKAILTKRTPYVMDTAFGKTRFKGSKNA